MSNKAANKFCFRGMWYPTDLVRKAACKSYDLPEKDFENDEKLAELVDAIVRGAPTPCSNFIVALNEGRLPV